MVNMARMWSIEMKYVTAYAISGMMVIMTPAINFSTSRINAAILPLVAELKKSLISKMLAKRLPILSKMESELLGAMSFAS